MSIDTKTRAARGLPNRVAAPVVMPGDAEWDSARRAWNLAVDQQPAAVVSPESAEDVIAVVGFARERGLRVAPQGTGHGAAAMSSLSDTVLLKTERMREIRVDPGARRVRVGAGALWADVTAVAGEHGLAALAGSSPDVGVTGYTLGGGLSWLARRYGLAANSVLAIELVTADGRLVRADHEHEPDLFWALRGGGGSFGVVTALELQLYPVRDVYAGALLWPMERAAEILEAWRDWAGSVPDDVTSLGRLLQVPPLPEIPEPLRGRSFVGVEAVCLGEEAQAVALLEPLRALAPELDSFATVPASALSALHMDPDHPVPATADGMLLCDLPPAAVHALVATAGAGSGSPLVSVDLHHLEGALARSEEGHGAAGSLDAGFALFAVGMALDREMATTVDARIRLVQGTLATWGAGQRYLNFAERPGDAHGMFSADAFRRLREVKRQYDPAGLLHANHPIPAAV